MNDRLTIRVRHLYSTLTRRTFQHATVALLWVREKVKGCLLRGSTAPSCETFGTLYPTLCSDAAAFY
jgi:hypothetical protein